MIKLKNKVLVALGTIGVLIAMGVGTSAQLPGVAGTTQKPCIYVFGEVNEPKQFELTGPKRLSDALSLADGLTKRAGGKILIVHLETCGLSFSARPPRGFDVYLTEAVQRGDEKSDPPLHSGDMIVVPEHPVVYIVGAVVSPQAIIMDRPITLSKAVAKAGGLTRDAQKKTVKIYRISAEKTVEAIVVDLKKVMEKKIPDPSLNEFDIVEVIEKHRRDLIKDHIMGNIVDWKVGTPEQ